MAWLFDQINSHYFKLLYKTWYSCIYKLCLSIKAVNYSRWWISRVLTRQFIIYIIDYYLCYYQFWNSSIGIYIYICIYIGMRDMHTFHYYRKVLWKRVKDWLLITKTQFPLLLSRLFLIYIYTHTHWNINFLESKILLCQNFHQQ